MSIYKRGAIRQSSCKLELLDSSLQEDCLMVGKVTRLHGHRKKVDRLTKAERLERAARLWAIYRNFEPVRKRSERKQHYRHPGIAP